MKVLALILIVSFSAMGAIPTESFPIGPRGPHNGELVRAVPNGPHEQVPNEYKKLYFELVIATNELEFYPFLESDKKGYLVPDIALSDFPEYRVDARSPQNRLDIRLFSYRGTQSIHAAFGAVERRQLELMPADPCTFVITVIHEEISKEALFQSLSPIPEPTVPKKTL